MKFKIILLVLFILLESCKNKHENKTQRNFDLDKIEWLLGSWKLDNDTIESYQVWEKINDSIYNGLVYMLNQQDTLITESITIQKQDDTISYESVRKNEFNQSFTYRLVVNNNGEHVFENPEYTFPKRIIYILQNDGSQYNRAEGHKEGEDLYIENIYHRIK